MLRRTERIVLKDDHDSFEPDDAEFDAFGRDDVATEDAGRDDVGAMRAEIERAFSSRLEPDPAAAAPEVERITPRSGRRSTDALRSEVQWTVVTNDDGGRLGGLRSSVRWRSAMPRSRIILLAVALLAGGLAAFLATRGSEQPVPQVAAQAAPETVTEVVQEARTQILVARQAIGVGQRLSPASVEWVDWPQGAVRPEYITVAATPEAIADMAGAVARYEFFPGEPIREQKLSMGAPGMLSGVLESGLRGVSVSVAAESASGGFISPNDHVDVVMTRESDQGRFSETILHNVRVLAIDARLAGAPTAEAHKEPEIFEGQAIATLALDATEAEVIIGAATAGRLSLVLRSILDFAEVETAAQQPANLAIRMSSPFWSK